MNKQTLDAETKQAIETAKTNVLAGLDEVNVALELPVDDVYGQQRRINCAVSYLQTAIFKLMKTHGILEIYKDVEGVDAIKRSGRAIIF